MCLCSPHPPAGSQRLWGARPRRQVRAWREENGACQAPLDLTEMSFLEEAAFCWSLLLGLKRNLDESRLPALKEPLRFLLEEWERHVVPRSVPIIRREQPMLLHPSACNTHLQRRQCSRKAQQLSATLCFLILFILHPHRPILQARHFCADVDEVTQLLKKLLGQCCICSASNSLLPTIQNSTATERERVCVSWRRYVLS